MVLNDCDGFVMSSPVSKPRVQKIDVNKTMRWAVFQCQNRRELLAEQQLANQGFQVFMPTISVSAKYHRQRIAPRKPLFPGYGFVKICGNLRWQAINGTVGVTRLISSSTEPLYLPSGFVENLFDLTDENGRIDFKKLYKKGDRVCILTGPFLGVIAEIESTDSRGRITVLLSLLNSQVRLHTNTSNVSPASMTH